jgi:hypothetical protein
VSRARQAEFLSNGVVLSTQGVHQLLKPIVFVKGTKIGVSLKQPIVGKTEFRATPQLGQGLVGVADERISSRAKVPRVMCVRQTAGTASRLIS